VTVTIQEEEKPGRNAAVPDARYGKNTESVAAAIHLMEPKIRRGKTREEPAADFFSAAARNAIDCPLRDIEYNLTGQTAAPLAGLGKPTRQVTAYILGLGSAESMRDAARANAERPLLRVKLGSDGDGDRIRAVHEGAPEARLIVDANEGWRSAKLAGNIDACRDFGIELIEEPLPGGDDAALIDRPRGIAVYVDECINTRADLPRLQPRYDAINPKLDKAGDLTDAFLLKVDAQAQDFAITFGCMLGSSLAVAPALMLAQGVDYGDLAGPLLLAADRSPPLSYVEGKIHLPSPALWG